MVYVNEKFLTIMMYYISSKSYWKMLFSGNVFGKQYLHKYTNNYTTIRIWISVSKLQNHCGLSYKYHWWYANEKDFFYPCKKFVYKYDYVNFFWKIDGVLLEYVILYEKEYYKFLLFGGNNFTNYKIVTLFNNALVSNCNIITF